MTGSLTEAQTLLTFASESPREFDGIESAKQKLAITQISLDNITDKEISTLKDQLAKDAKDPIARTKLGILEERKGNTEAAIAEFRKALEHSPTNFFALVQLGNALLSTGDIEAANTIAQTAIEQDSRNRDAVLLQGEIALAQRRYKWAASLFQNAASDSPDEPRIQFNLGLALYALGNRADATKVLNGCLPEIDSEELSEFGTQLIEMLGIGSSSFSEQSMKRVSAHLTTYPNDTFALAMSGTLKLRNQQAEEAQSELESALQINPDNVFAKLGLAEILSEDSTNASRVYAIASQAREFDSETNRARALQGIALSQQDKVDLAKAQFESVEIETLPTTLRERVEELMGE